MIKKRNLKTTTKRHLPSRTTAASGDGIVLGYSIVVTASICTIGETGTAVALPRGNVDANFRGWKVGCCKKVKKLLKHKQSKTNKQYGYTYRS